MSALADLLVAVAVVALVVSRQLKARRVDTERRLWLLPLILGVLALRDPKLLDPGHPTAAALLLAGSLATVLAMGCVWGWTVRLWRESDGTVWARGTAATAAAWGGMLVLRLGWWGLGSALHVRQDTSALLLSLGVLLLARGVVVNRRAARRFEPVGV
ncbi:DUF1453 domain-containing protein [Kitasatospora paranensis]|uniref:DUF1453 domain-containing protein n=1 Tax=Kitasatospora paranensis TaxID=258053 RepID=A0ABW2G6G4_9ACTN